MVFNSLVLKGCKMNLQFTFTFIDSTPTGGVVFLFLPVTPCIAGGYSHFSPSG